MTDLIEVNGQERQIPFVGDNGQPQDTDWLLSGELLEQIKQAGEASSFRVVFSQYAHADHKTSCTKFAPFNALCSDMGYSPKLEDIQEVEEMSIQAGFRIGSGWFRGSGVDIVRRWWNKKFPNSEVFSFTGTLFTPEYYEILKMGRTIICSITVDSRYWRDVLGDGRLDSMEFGPGGGHATAFRAKNADGSVVEFMDSVGGRTLESGSIYSMTEEQLKEKARPVVTLRQDFHFFIPKNVIPMIAKDVPTGQRYSEAVKEILETGIMTNDKDGKFRPSNNITRAEVAMIVKRILERQK